MLCACGQFGDTDAVVSPEESQASAADDAHRGRDGAELLGTVPSEFEVDAWIVDGAAADRAITLASLRGSVVLVRLWTDTCPFCKATAPALVQLADEFGDRGLVVIGIHHPKPRPAADEADRAPIDEVAAVAKAWGMRFPIGIDRHWRTVDRWWLDGGDRSATSASFLIDRLGVIRWVHPGPEYHPKSSPDPGTAPSTGQDAHAQCHADFAALHAAIEQLLR